MSSRREARKIVLQVLYQVDIIGDSEWKNTLRHLVVEKHLDKASKKFTRELIEGTLKNLPELDALISGASQNWKISRMAVVDRNILRLAICEMLYQEDIPSAVSIDEAIELGKQYSGEKSAAFINGILDRVYKTIGENKKATEVTENTDGKDH